MDDNVRKFRKKPKETPVRDFLKKPMHETTVGDTLVLHASTVVLTIVITTAVQGWIYILSRKVK